ncbi:MAG TPA: LuxR C-terminal-related transcriptional regulator [Ktedonobacteraceae bacterium]|jgi:LuxR family maltose regulon positive regulatory protein|nr:LuxR C-terminal-related transcriptional regulator [Ktedonobacteraceae bacterium]
MQPLADEHFLLSTKLTMPLKSLKNCISRPRLYERLGKTTQGACTLLAAPAGFGKTCLVGTWLRAYHPTASWVTLDAKDNDPTCFWHYIIHALSQHETAIAERFAQWHTHSPDETMLTLLINTLSDIPHDVLLVLDDYQHITRECIHQMLTFLLEHQPAHFHLLILSRSNPPLPLARLRVKGLLGEIRAQDLRFTLDETVTFLSMATGLTLSSQDVALLDWHTEGWAAGLRLAAISLQRFADPATTVRSIRSYNGENRHVFHYLAQEVLAQQPEEVTHFLYTTSILETFTPALCDTITTHQNASAILTHLLQHDLFLLTLNTQEGWYRYHRLFKNLLQQHLKQRQETELQQLHDRASHWYEEQGYYVEAISHAFEAANLEHAITLIEQHAWSFMRRGEVELVNFWLARLPECFYAGHPLISYLRACIYQLHARYPEYEKAMLCAENVWQKEQNDEMLSRVYDTRAYNAMINGAGVQAIEYAQKALELAPTEEIQIHASATIALGAGNQLLGNTLQARLAFIKGYHLCLKSHQTTMALIAVTHLAEIQTTQGKLSEAIQTLQQELPEIGKSTQRGRSIIHLRLCELYREWNDVPQAQMHWQQAIQLMNNLPSQKFLLAESYLHRARLLWIQGHAEEALQQLDQAEQHPQLTTRNHILQAQLTACRIQILLADDKLDEALRWVQAHPPIQGTPLVDEQEAWAITQARLYLAQHSYQQALNILEGPLQLAHAQGRKASIIKLLVPQAMVYQAQGVISQAFQSLEYALTLARMGGYIRIFLDEGLPMGKLLNDYAQNFQKKGQGQQQEMGLRYLHNLLAAFSPETQTPSWSSTSSAELPPFEKLSDRELKVLHMIADGLSNQGIADSLLVSISTIKTHLNNIYAKLRVHTRLQAVTKAYDLGIIAHTTNMPDTIISSEDTK